MCKISVIMPVHTKGEYFAETIRSLENQTFKDYQLILVNDNCRDKQVLDIIKNKELNGAIVINNDKSIGAALSRNLGFAKATGEYVIFVDSDDIFKPNYLQSMLDCIETNHADACVCTFSCFMDNPGNIIVSKCNSLSDIKSHADKDDYLISLPTNPWTKLVRRSFLIENDITFQDIPSCNDVYYSAMIYLTVDSICFVDDALILYRQNSAGAISRNRNSLNIFYAIEAIFNELEKRNLRTEKNTKMLLALLLCCARYEMCACADIENNFKLFFLMRKFYRKYTGDILDDLFQEKYNRYIDIYSFLKIFYYYLRPKAKRVLGFLGLEETVKKWLRRA